MNKESFFVTKNFACIFIIIIAISTKLCGMYPHDYTCQKHHHSGPYPYRIVTNRIIKALDAAGEYAAVNVYESEDRAFDQFEDGKAPLVVALRAFDNRQNEELEKLKQLIEQERIRFRKDLGRPAHGGKFVPEKNNAQWQGLRERLNIPPADQIKIWENRLSQFPVLWQTLEKVVLTANIFGSKKADYFRTVLLTTIAEGLDATAWAYTTPFVDQLDERDAVIAQEREQKQRAETQLRDQQKVVADNAAELQRLSPSANQLLSLLRQKAGRPVYNGQYVEINEPVLRQNLQNRIDNPPAEQIQASQNLLNDPALSPLFELLRRRAMASSDEFRTFALLVMAHLRDASISAYACPITERLNEANANLLRESEQKQKIQADLEAERKRKEEVEKKSQEDTKRLREEKKILSDHFETEITALDSLSTQRHEHAIRQIAALRTEASSYKDELLARRDISPIRRRRIEELERELATVREKNAVDLSELKRRRDASAERRRQDSLSTASGKNQ